MKNLLFSIVTGIFFIFIWLSISQAEEFQPIQSLGQQLKTQITIGNLFDQAYKKNPLIHAARKNWRAAVEKYKIATSYPDPQFMITYFPQPIETRLGPQDWNANLSQMIPFPGKLSKAGKIVQADVNLAKLNLDKTVRDIMVEIRKSYHELIYIQQAKKIAQQNAKLLEQLRNIGENAYAQDKTAFIDIVKLQSQSAQLQYDIILLDELEQTEKTRLNSLLNQKPDTPLGTLESLPVKPIIYKLDEIYSLAQNSQEEIRMANLQTEKAKYQEELASYKNMPDFKVGIFYASIGTPDSANPPSDAGDDAIGIQFGMNIPIWFGKNKSRISSAHAITEKSKAVKINQINTTRTKIHTLYFKLNNSKRLINLYKNEMLPQAVNALETSQTWFQQGQGSFSDFAEAQAAAYNFQLSLERAKADYGKNLASLEQLAGHSLTEKLSGSEPDSQEIK